jgi:hypothetical protein
MLLPEIDISVAIFILRLCTSPQHENPTVNTNTEVSKVTVCYSRMDYWEAQTGERF